MRLVALALRRAAAGLLLATVGSFAACDDGRRSWDDDEDDDGAGAGSSTGGGDESVQQLCVDLINDYRASLGLPPYTRWTEAESCSDGEAQSDGDTNEPHGAFGTCDEWAQNECPGWPGPPEQMIPQCLALMWDEGPGGGHYDTMASTDYTMVACGFWTFSDGSVWAVQNYK